MLKRLFLIFSKIGAFTFGGGMAMIPLIQREIVENEGWMEEEKFVDYIALAQSAPGPLAINIAVLVGYDLAGLSGAVVASLGSALPSITIILIVAMFFQRIQDNPYVIKIFNGIRPAVVSLILIAFFSISRQIEKTWVHFIIIISTAVLVAFFNVNPIIMILAGGVGGLIYYRRKGFLK